MQTAPDQLNFDDDWLMFFPDETGHETFAGDQPYFAVGGCAMLGAHHAAVAGQWRDLRCTINGDRGAGFHGSRVFKGAAVIQIGCDAGRDAWRPKRGVKIGHATKGLGCEATSGCRSVHAVNLA